MRKSKNRNSAPVTPARPAKHTLHFLLHGNGNETVQGTLVLDNFPVQGDMAVGSTPVLPTEEAYDQAGASVYAIVVIAVYGFSIVMLIASHIFLKKKADKRDGGDEKQIDKYLAQVPSLKEKSKRDSFRRLKKSIIPLISVSMANDITTAIAAGPVGHSALQRHMEMLDQRLACRSPSRSTSGGFSPVGNRSPTGGVSPRSHSPSFDDSFDDNDESVRIDIPLERDRSFDRVSQSRMPIIVEIDEATDSPTLCGKPLVTSESVDNRAEDNAVSCDTLHSLTVDEEPGGQMNPWEEQDMSSQKRRALRREDTPRPGTRPPSSRPPPISISPTAILQVDTLTADVKTQRSRSPRRCNPYELTFDFPERKGKAGCQRGGACEEGQTGKRAEACEKRQTGKQDSICQTPITAPATRFRGEESHSLQITFV